MIIKSLFYENQKNQKIMNKNIQTDENIKMSDDIVYTIMDNKLDTNKNKKIDENKNEIDDIENQEINDFRPNYGDYCGESGLAYVNYLIKPNYIIKITMLLNALLIIASIIIFIINKYYNPFIWTFCTTNIILILIFFINHGYFHFINRRNECCNIIRGISVIFAMLINSGVIILFVFTFKFDNTINELSSNTLCVKIFFWINIGINLYNTIIYLTKIIFKYNSN